MIDANSQEFDDNLLNKVGNILQGNDKNVGNLDFDTPGCSYTESPDVVITGSTKAKVTSLSKSSNASSNLPTWPDGNQHIKVKQEVYAEKSAERKIKFTFEEDQNLYDGIKKYGKGRWSKILKDQSFSFHKCRTRDALRLRAESATFRHSVSKLNESTSNEEQNTISNNVN